jgi:hypothetical protein
LSKNPLPEKQKKRKGNTTEEEQLNSLVESYRSDPVRSLVRQFVTANSTLLAYSEQKIIEGIQRLEESESSDWMDLRKSIRFLENEQPRNRRKKKEMK